LEEDRLFKKFRMDEPWDSEHNKELLAEMPKLYAPVRGSSSEPHATAYQVFVYPQATRLARTPFGSLRSWTLGQITARDGIHDTLMIIEAGKPVPWTKPADLAYEADK